jgi:septation ring formation regulator EzrA
VSSSYEVQESDLLKLRDAITNAEEFHQLRDRMNAQLHLARETRYSPLTSELSAAHDRITAIIEGERRAPREESEER